MRSRDVTIPLGLWICAAICAHFLFGTGGLVVAQDAGRPLGAVEAVARGEQPGAAGRPDLRGLAGRAAARRRRKSCLRPRHRPTRESPARDRSRPRSRPEEAPKPEEKKPKEKKVVIVKKDEETKPIVLPEDPLKDWRIAVRQHASPISRTTRRRSSSPIRPTTSTTRRARRRRRTTATTSSPTPGGNHPGSATRRPATARRRASPRARPTRATRTARRARRARTTTSSTSRRSRSWSSSRTGTAATPPAQGGQRASASESPRAVAAVAAVGAAAHARRRDAAVARGRDARPDGTWTFNPARPGGPPGSTPQRTAGLSDAEPPGRQDVVAAWPGSERDARRDEHEPDAGAGRVDRRPRQPAKAARGRRRATEERAPRLVDRVELRAVAQRDRELRLEREARQPDGAQHRRRCRSPRT